MIEDISPNVPNNQESIKPSRLMVVTKWCFWITVCLYIAYITTSYFLDLSGYGEDLSWHDYLYLYFREGTRILGYMTLFMLLISSISFFRKSAITSKVTIGTMIVVILFTIFGYQGASLGANKGRHTFPTNCDICGRPFWSRGFFFRRRKEAKLIKTNSWNIIKE